ncbi:MAG: iron-containing alcohol dehydrogenase, partial [Clostridia bacterium]|nr:iron-containing alcohol dehydrogenase [Clostridia bacterium]
MLLVPVMKFNEPVCRERFAECYDRCAHDGSRLTTAEEKSAWIIRRLDEIVRHLEIPVSLKEFGVPEEDLEGLVQAGMQVTRLLV